MSSPNNLLGVGAENGARQPRSTGSVLCSRRIPGGRRERSGAHHLPQRLHVEWREATAVPASAVINRCPRRFVLTPSAARAADCAYPPGGEGFVYRNSETDTGSPLAAKKRAI